MDELGLVHVTEDGLDRGRRLPQDAPRLHRAVIRQSARDLAPIRIEAADDLSAFESAFAGDDADRQKALAFVRKRADRARAERELARETNVIGKPLLAR